MKLPSRALTAATLFLLTNAVACRSDSPLVSRPPRVASVRVSPAVDTLLPGGGKLFRVSLSDSAGTPIEVDSLGVPAQGYGVLWSSSNTEVATVSASGFVAALAVGSAIITAESGGTRGSARVEVRAPAVFAVMVRPGTAEIPVSGTAQFTVEVIDAFGQRLSGRQIDWTTSDPAVATVSPTGLVTGRSPGDTEVIATSGGKSDTVRLRVFAP
ncbi:MAG: Ig-like domain-containing protein [Gemmatimonadaceae bacterium]